jgi:acetyltransferase-like isoleucine patch superfamily enzyme
MKILFFIYYYTEKIFRRLGLLADAVRFRILLANPKISKGHDIKSMGLPMIRVGKNSRLSIGDRLKMNDGNKNNFIGRDSRCLLVVGDNAQLVIGNNVGMSSSTIVACLSVRLGENVRLGGNVVIYDTDFHSLLPEERLSPKNPGIQKAPVVIEDNVFVGAHSTILKGVTIGTNSVIGAGSVVTKNVPPNEIWAGNPAKFIKKLSN